MVRVWEPLADLPAISRYIVDLNTWLVYRAIVDKSPLVKGSTGQLRANPLARRMDLIALQLRSAEEHFGLTPLSRMRLGIEYTTAMSALEQARRAMAVKPPPVFELPEDWHVVNEVKTEAVIDA